MLPSLVNVIYLSRHIQRSSGACRGESLTYWLPTNDYSDDYVHTGSRAAGLDKRFVDSSVWLPDGI